MIVKRKHTLPISSTVRRYGRISSRRLQSAGSPSRSAQESAGWHLRLIPAALLCVGTLTIPTSALSYVERAVDQLLKTKECVRCDLRNADLRGRDLSRAKLTGAYLVGARLGGTSLVEADLTGAHMAGADLAGANLERATLTGADLTRANFTRAHLHGASLTRARLSGAPLTNADVREAKLDGTRLQGADLRGAKGLSQEQLQRACGDRASALPEGLRLTTCGGPVRKNRDRN